MDLTTPNRMARPAQSKRLGGAHSGTGSFVIGKPQNHSRPQREDADEEARDNRNFHDILLGLIIDLTMASSESIDLGSPICHGIDITRACLGQQVVWREPLVESGIHSLVINSCSACYIVRRFHV
jgi:hypothetical protein